MLTPDQIAQFHHQGFLLIEDLLTESDLAPVISAYTTYIDQRAQALYTSGELSQSYAELPFERRLAAICQETSAVYANLDIMHLRARALFDFLHHPKLLDLAEAFVGPEILCSPIQHVRPKLPNGLTPRGNDPHVVHWHQDAGVAWEEADPYFILTIWIPLVDATPENGCLRLLAGLHHEGLLPHRTKRGLGTAIHGDLLAGKSIVTLPMRKGSVLLMHKYTPHSSSRNRSDGVRWSMDLRYQAVGTATGRPFHPAFVVRSQQDPASVLANYDEWCRRWEEALSKSNGTRVHRWGEE